MAEIFWVFLKLGLTSFGGPIAHLGYFREEFVRRRQWLDDAGFAQLLAVCQFLPGPASSQLGFAIGLFRGGWRGALMAFVGFTLPSALLMFGFAMLVPHVDGGIGDAVVHGLKLVAVAVVAQGILGMARQLTPDVSRVLIAAIAAALILLTGNVWMQLVAIALGGAAGLWMCRRVTPPPAATFPVRYGTGVAMSFFVLFLVGLFASLALPAEQTVSTGGLAAAFYRAGALVFGGGHVVLPLLQHTVVEPGWVTSDAFLAGYGAAQAMPGPMFSLAAFLGARASLDTSPGFGASIALIAVFLPGFLLLLAVLPVWTRLAARSWAIRVMAGINAAVVGLLVAAFYDPVWTQGIRGFADVVIAAVAFVMLMAFRLSALWAVLWCVVASVALTL